MIGEGKKIRLIMYDLFRIVENIGTNAFYLDIPLYKHMYSIINVESLKLYEPSMIMDKVEDIQVCTIDDFAPEYLNELRRMSFSKGELRLHIELMWSTSELDLKGFILARLNGLWLEG